MQLSYIISAAKTKKVVTKGIIKVSQGQCNTMANANAAEAAKNNNQYNPFDFLFTSILFFYKNRGECLETICPKSSFNLYSSLHFCIFAATVF